MGASFQLYLDGEENFPAPFILVFPSRKPLLPSQLEQMWKGLQEDLFPLIAACAIAALLWRFGLVGFGVPAFQNACTTGQVPEQDVGLP